jgi:hypothetical protein
LVLVFAPSFCSCLSSLTSLVLSLRASFGSSIAFQAQPFNMMPNVIIMITTTTTTTTITTTTTTTYYTQPPPLQPPTLTLTALRRSILESVAQDHAQQRAQSVLQKLNPLS